VGGGGWGGGGVARAFRGSIFDDIFLHNNVKLIGHTFKNTHTRLTGQNNYKPFIFILSPAF